MSWYKLPSGMPWYVEGTKGLAVTLLAEGAVLLPDDQVADTVAAWASRAPSTPLPSGSLSGQVADLRAALTGYTARTVTGAVSLPAVGLHALDLTGNTTLTLTGNDGASVVLDVALGGHTLTVEGETVAVDGPVQCLRSRGGWLVYPLNAVPDGGGETPDPEPVEVTPAAPTFDDAADTYTIPATTGVVYAVDGTTKTAGTYSVGNVAATLTVTATAASGYVIADGADTSWTLEFTVTDQGGGDDGLAWTTVASDDFTGTNGTPIPGRTTPVGGLTWVARDADKGSDVTIQNGRASYTAGTFQTGSTVDLGHVPGNIRVSLASTQFPSTTNPGYAIVIGLGYIGKQTTVSGTIYLTLHATGAIDLSDRGYGNPAATYVGQSTGISTSAKIALQMEGDGAISVLVDDQVIGTAQVDGTIEGKAFFDGQAAYSFDDFTVETA